MASPSLAFLKSSLKTWEAKHKYRQRQLDIAHQKNDVKGINKWKSLLKEAGVEMTRRTMQIHAIENPPPSGRRVRAVTLMYQARADSNRRPYAWRYLAGGRPSLICLVPSPSGDRSDCSQWAVNIDREAGCPKPPGSGTFLYSNTDTIKNGKRLSGPKVGAYGLYGTIYHTHHVERVASVNPLVFVGHGTRFVDSRTPGLPDFYIDMVE